MNISSKRDFIITFVYKNPLHSKNKWDDPYKNARGKHITIKTNMTVSDNSF